MEKVIIRVLRADDAEAVATLSASLGYPTSPAEVQSRIESLADSNDRMAFAAICKMRWLDGSMRPWSGTCNQNRLW